MLPSPSHHSLQPFFLNSLRSSKNLASSMPLVLETRIYHQNAKLATQNPNLYLWTVLSNWCSQSTSYTAQMMTQSFNRSVMLPTWFWSCCSAAEIPIEPIYPSFPSFCLHLQWFTCAYVNFTAIITHWVQPAWGPFYMVDSGWTPSCTWLPNFFITTVLPGVNKW